MKRASKARVGRGAARRGPAPRAPRPGPKSAPRAPRPAAPRACGGPCPPKLPGLFQTRIFGTLPRRSLPFNKHKVCYRSSLHIAPPILWECSVILLNFIKNLLISSSSVSTGRVPKRFGYSFLKRSFVLVSGIFLAEFNTLIIHHHKALWIRDVGVCLMKFAMLVKLYRSFTCRC